MTGPRMPGGLIDLHAHTTASDGQHPPAELLALAAQAGLGTLAVTDHDTVGGLAACAAEAAARGLRLVPGIEVSAFLNRREVHLLGHFIEPAEPRLAAFSRTLRESREGRMAQMVAKLQGLGFPVTLAQVRGLAGADAHLARPHLARVLVELNYCTSTKEAFSRFLGDGRPAFVERYQLGAEEAIALIHGARGVATLAHPGTSKVNHLELEALAQAGLDGLEVAHADHPPSAREKFAAWARALRLAPTAGSDFHGAQVAPTRRLGSVSMGQRELDALEARRPG